MNKAVSKIFPALISVVVLSEAARGQGTVSFANRLSAATFVPLYAPDGITRLEGPGYSAQFYAEIGGRLTAVGNPVPFRTGAIMTLWEYKVETVSGVFRLSFPSPPVLPAPQNEVARHAGEGVGRGKSL